MAIRQDNYIKIHLHANSSEELRSSVSKLGRVVKWSEDDLMEQTKNFGVSLKPALHIVTDAAGSVTRNDAAELGFSLLDSYISLGRLDMPETCLEPSVLILGDEEGIRVQAHGESNVRCWDGAMKTPLQPPSPNCEGGLDGQKRTAGTFQHNQYHARGSWSG